MRTAALTLLLALGACAAPRDIPVAESQPIPQAETVAAADDAEETAPARTQIAAIGRGAPTRPVTPPEPVPEALATPDPEDQLEQLMILRATPEDLNGSQVGDVAAMLGRPSLVRTESPSEIWQYRTPDCVLDVFLRDAGAGLTVDHVEGRGRDGVTLDTESCMDRIVSENAF